MSAMNPPVIDIRGLWTRFGETVVHQDLDLTINHGEILSLVGGSGSGKTTLMRQMLGLAKPAKGCVNVLGYDVTHADSVWQLRNRWGVLFQQGALFSALTVFDNVALPMRELRVLPEEVIHDAVLLKLSMVGISPGDAMKLPADLSGGMVKRVALARALALEPELLFLDEPTSGLDPHLSDSFVELIRSLHEELHFTVIMISHDLDTILALSTQIAVLAEKRVVAKGTLREVLAMRHSFIDEFFLGTRGRRALNGTGISLEACGQGGK